MVTYPYRVFIDRLVGVAYVFDPTTRQAAVWVRRAVELDMRSFVTPFRVLLSWIANTIGGEIVHASAAVVDGSGLLVSGASGSGKSTLAIGLGVSGQRLISDDCVMVHDGVLHAVFARAKLDEQSGTRVGAADLELGTVPGAPRAKRFLLVESLGDRFEAQHSLGTIGFSAIYPRAASFRVSERRAYQLLSTDSLREVFGGTTRNRLRLARAVRGRPAHRLLLGPSMGENIDLVRRVMAEVPADGSRQWAEAER